ncbi:DUF349 domain-containing protein [Hoyosella rhizosphaerae]|uniref:DUF349 domain-containing protein n=1 Tax=Hoyosella rhizosphaerae TaxID=1755582 RepID=A0A916U720_9ACTN|nr:DUF349 domain-containing protein [Hoyosella rhizosphaerae]MBN4926341.1 DUF349 domain-containing protein [Hoyosella rhizosphaerae]GGC60104.1 hypothetical protein GCM10011410_10730 [Hoyosella rhizosphaerae]
MTESTHPKPGAPVNSAGHEHAAPSIKALPSQFGRIDEDGSVWLITADGERQIGSWHAGDRDEGLAHFARRFDDFVTEVELLEARLATGASEPKKTKSAAQHLIEALPTATVIGDVAAVEKRLHAIMSGADKAAEKAQHKREEHRAKLIERKEELCVEAEDLAANATQWKSAGDRLREMFDEWKAIRGIDRKTDDALWKRFSKARDAFNRRRGAHFAELDRERVSAKTRKEELADKAESLATSTDWGATAAAFRDLMKEWKAAGRAPREADDALWKRFKSAQDSFFAARNAAASERDAEFEENATVKEDLLKAAESLDPSKDLDAARAGLRTLQEKWESAGRVPRERMHDLESRFKAIESRIREAVDSQWRRSDPEAEARAAQFRERVQQFEEQAEKAEAAGRKKDAEKARASAQQWREWADAAENAVSSR